VSRTTPVRLGTSAHIEQSYLLHKFGYPATDGQTGINMTVDRDDIRGCLVDIDVIRDGEPLDPDESLFERGLIDSLGITILITHLEKKYAIKVPQHDLLPDNFDSISAISDYVNSKHPGNGQG
jgi:acyl carrier protein